MSSSSGNLLRSGSGGGYHLIRWVPLTYTLTLVGRPEWKTPYGNDGNPVKTSLQTAFDNLAFSTQYGSNPPVVLCTAGPNYFESVEIVGAVYSVTPSSGTVLVRPTLKTMNLHVDDGYGAALPCSNWFMGTGASNPGNTNPIGWARNLIDGTKGVVSYNNTSLALAVSSFLWFVVIVDPWSADIYDSYSPGDMSVAAFGKIDSYLIEDSDPS